MPRTRSIRRQRTPSRTSARDAAGRSAAWPRPRDGRAPRRSMRACRPRQWAKNVLVLAAPAAAGRIGRDAVLTELLVAFVAMCMASSATYLVNDVRDLEQDRKHPRKRTRPVAAGEISARTALTWAVVLAVGAIALALRRRSRSLPSWSPTSCSRALTRCGSGVYRSPTSWQSRRLRPARAGRRRGDGHPLVALVHSRDGLRRVFLVACKRYAELREHRANSGTRSTLAVYTPQRLQAIILDGGVRHHGLVRGVGNHALRRRLAVRGIGMPLLLWLVRYGSPGGRRAGPGARGSGAA